MSRLALLLLCGVWLSVHARVPDIRLEFSTSLRDNDGPADRDSGGLYRSDRREVDVDDGDRLSGDHDGGPRWDPWPFQDAPRGRQEPPHRADMAPEYPRFRDEMPRDGPRFRDEMPRDGPRFRDEMPRDGPRFRDEMPRDGPRFRDEMPRDGPRFRDEMPRDGPRFRDEDPGSPEQRAREDPSRWRSDDFLPNDPWKDRPGQDAPGAGDPPVKEDLLQLRPDPSPCDDGCRQPALLRDRGDFVDTPEFWKKLDKQLQEYFCRQLDHVLEEQCHRFRYDKPYIVLIYYLRNACYHGYSNVYFLPELILDHCAYHSGELKVEAAYDCGTGCPLADFLNQLCYDLHNPGCETEK